jgi:FlaA1/EpsC-like NDP-sugar epimerase
MAGECDSDTFIMISTDKAANRTPFMGATKRVAELSIQMLEHRFPSRHVADQFGNALGLVRLVISKFREQIARRGR